MKAKLVPADHPPSLLKELERFNSQIGSYLKPDDVSRIKAAYAFSEAAHRGQFRISGDPYISHPLAVAQFLAEWRLDPQSLIAALLHDVMEDTPTSKEQIARRFGKVAANLVDGVSKIDRLEHQTFEEAQAETLRKMLMAMARDVRVIVIKLADRLHNMKTLGAMRPEKQRRIARETLDIYAPIANRLGLNALYRELQDLSFCYVHPYRYRVLEKAVKGARGNRRAVFTRIYDAIRHILPKHGVEAEVMGREKHLFSIYCKMREKRLSFSQVLDIFGFRIVVKDRPSCYLALGVLHALYPPIPGKFKDYIAIPKANGYQSLHTTLIGPFGTPVELQIRTTDMHHVAESGVASHWLYKDESAFDQFQKRTSKWLKFVTELQSSSGDSAEFLEHIKVDLFPGEVYVYSPRGKIFTLPSGSTAVDFAYAVHTDIGNHCVDCHINFEKAPLRARLHNGDRVEIITDPTSSPSPSWLGFVQSSRARAKIRHYLKTQQLEESAALGENLLLQALRGVGVATTEVPVAIWDRIWRDSGGRSMRNVLADIGLGKRLPAIVARRLAESLGVDVAKDEAATETRAPSPILIKGGDGLAIQLCKCCRPIPGDPIVGLVRKGQGLMVHTQDCRLVTKLRGERNSSSSVAVDWEADIDNLFETHIRVVADNGRGVLARLATEIAETQSDVLNVSMDDDRGGTTSVYFTLQVKDRSHLARIMRALRRIPEVIRIGRYAEAET